MKNRGFTLIEILIVVAIIGLLATMGMIAFQTSLRRSRDSRRLQEIKALQGAAEQFYADNNGYPDGSACSLLDDYTRGFEAGYVDPRGEAYKCTFDGTNDTYCICIPMEDADAGNAGLADCNSIGSGTGFQCAENLF